MSADRVNRPLFLEHGILAIQYFLKSEFLERDDGPSMMTIEDQTVLLGPWSTAAVSGLEQDQSGPTSRPEP